LLVRTAFLRLLGGSGKSPPKLLDALVQKLVLADIDCAARDLASGGGQAVK